MDQQATIFYKACSGENSAAGPVKIKTDSIVLVAEQIWLEGKLWFQMRKALLAMLELLSQFECETKSVFAKVFNDGNSGLVELHECLKMFLPGGATST